MKFSYGTFSLFEGLHPTFAFKQSSIEEKQVLKSIVNSRSEKIKEFVKTGEFKIIKKSNSNIRIYENIIPFIEIENPVWVSTENIMSDEWMRHFKKILYNIPQVKYQTEQFCTRHKITDREPLLVMYYWLKGYTYKEIADKSLLSVDLVLKIFSKLINYCFQNASNIIIKIAEEKLAQNENEISKELLKFPTYLLYGLNRKVELDLLDLRFTERLGIIKITRFMDMELFNYNDDIKRLKKYLIINSDRILAFLKGIIPEISFEKIQKCLTYLEL